jgi:hypothetical protein
MTEQQNVCLNIDRLEDISTDDVKATKKQETTCAPGVKFEAGSCITLEILVEMAKAYNINNKNKIILSCKTEILHPNRYKKYLLREIDKRFKNICTDQLCWTQQDFIKKMDDVMREQLEKFTLRPEGPEGRFEWLNTININEVMEQYENIYKDFKFLGAVPMDFQEINLDGLANINLEKLYSQGKTKFGIVFNLDNSYQSGSHWVAGYYDIKDGKIYYFDSYGTKPEKRVAKLMEKFYKFYKSKNSDKKCDFRHNPTRHQYGNSECGVYSINFILQLLGGKSFVNITENKLKDEEVNKLRKKIFRNVDF